MQLRDRLHIALHRVALRLGFEQASLDGALLQHPLVAFLPIQRLLRDRRAVTALEYGLIASLIAVAIISSVTQLGKNISNTFSFIATKL